MYHNYTDELNNSVATYWGNSLAQELINGLNLHCLNIVYLCPLTLLKKILFILVGGYLLHNTVVFFAIH